MNVESRSTAASPIELQQPSQTYKSHLTLRYTKYRGTPFEKFDEGRSSGRMYTPEDKSSSGIFGTESRNIDRTRLGTPIDCDLLDKELRELNFSDGKPIGLGYDKYDHFRVERAQPFDTEESVKVQRPLTQEEKRALEQGKSSAYDSGFLVLDERDFRYKSPVTSLEPSEGEQLQGSGGVKQRVPTLVGPDVRRKLNEQEVSAQNARQERKRLVRTAARREKALQTQYPRGLTGPAARPATEDTANRSRSKGARTQRIEQFNNSMARRGYDFLSGTTAPGSKVEEPKLMQSKIRKDPPLSVQDRRLGATTFDRCFNQPNLFRANPERQAWQRNMMTRGRDYDIVTKAMLPSHLRPTVSPERKSREEHPSHFATRRFVDRS